MHDYVWTAALDTWNDNFRDMTKTALKLVKMLSVCLCVCVSGIWMATRVAQFVTAAHGLVILYAQIH